jgi:uncharacterized protein involved in exopolysaccharide biosynthesis/LysM repeat protein
MTLIGIIRLLRKHLVILMLMPILLAGLVIWLTQNPSFTYSSETTLYTGLASGSSVEMGKAISYFATNTDFDNLINVINSRQTQQEVSIRLLAQHLMLSKADPRFISQKAFDYLKKITPPYVNALIIKSNDQSDTPKSLPAQDHLNNPAPPEQIQKTEYQHHQITAGETLFSISHKYDISVDQLKALNGITDSNIRVGQTLKVGRLMTGRAETALKDSALNNSQGDTSSNFSFSKLYASSEAGKMLPASINEAAFDQTVKNLTDLLASSDTNFVSHLLNFDNPHYSIDAISSINVQRIGSSDLVKLKYTSDDPGICQQTLIFLTQVCLKNYKVLKENRSDAVVKYFEYQVNQATQKLNAGEDRLLTFNKDNNIINYYEQSKAVAGAKEDLDVDYNNMRIKLAGTEAAIKRLEEKLASQQKIQLKSAPILEKRNLLSQINTKIATAETIGYGNTANSKELPLLKIKAEKLKEEIRESVGQLYSVGNSTEGLPLSTLLTDWIANVLSYEELNAGLGVLSKRIKDFQKQYEIFAPAGANLKRIEREISVSEAEFLELLHGLNLAKLKMQDLELSSNLKPIDQPFFPLTPNPTKRKFMILGAAMFGFMIVLSAILALEFFDETLRNPGKAAKSLKLLPFGVFPKIYLKTEVLNFPYVVQRLLEMMVQQIGLLKKEKQQSHEPFHIVVCSTANMEGKTVISQSIASQLNKLGNKVALIGYSSESTQNRETFAGTLIAPEKQKRSSGRFSVINWLLGYSDDRIDCKSPFLKESEASPSKEDYYQYSINEDYFKANDYRELLSRNNQWMAITPDFILTEIPSLLYYPFPAGLIASADLTLLVCRANREWTSADQGALESISRLTPGAPYFVLNGVEMEVIESILGELPKKRNFLRRALKKVFRFQFKSKNQI